MEENNSIVVSAKVKPFNHEGRIHKIVPAGLNILEILDATLPKVMHKHAVVSVDGKVVQPAQYSVIPTDGSIVTLNVIPTGGGGGGKDIMRIVLTIAVIAVSAGVGAWAAAGMEGFAAAATMAGVAASVGMVGMMAVNALVPPATSKLSSLSGANSSESAALNITGMNNEHRPYDVIPRVYGRRKYCPPYAALPYSETQGDDAYFYLLFDFGYGELNLNDLRIGENTIDQYEGIEYVIHKNFTGEGLTIYRNATIQDDYSIRVKHDEPQIIETKDDTDEIGLDIGFTGLALFENSGRTETTVTLKIEYCVVGSENWLPYDGNTGIKEITAATAQQIRRGITIKPGNRGKWKVRVTRITADSTDDNLINDSYVVALRSITYASPCKYDVPHTVVEMKIKATDQLSGMVDEFSAIAASVLPVWIDGVWVMQETRNPAWIYTDVLCGSANPKPVAESRLNLTEIKEWADACDALAQNDDVYWTCDLVVDYQTTVFELLRDVAASGRAAFSMRDGKFTVVRDKPQSVPVQLITPRNSWGFSASKSFVDYPHALKVRFIDPDSDWQQGEVIVYDDGYDETNATSFDSLELLGCTRSDQAWREGRFALAILKLRPEVFSVSMDIENLVCTRGDLVHVAHDVPCIGDHWGRIKSVTINDGNVTAITMDEPAVMETGQAYVLRGRKASGECISIPIQTVAGENTSVTLETPMLELDAPAAGDLVVVGLESFAVTPMIVKSIDAGADFSAILELIDAAPEIHNADTGEIPPYNPHMGKAAAVETPPAVLLSIAEEGECTGEVYLSELVLSWRMPQGKWAPAVEIYTKSESGDWKLLDITSKSNYRYKSVVIGKSYEFLVRAIATGGKSLPLASCASIAITATGDTIAPPSPSNFIVEETIEGLRRFWWTMPNIPKDLAGYEIRYNNGTSKSWDTASRLSDNIVSKAPFETSAIMKGTHTVLIKAIDYAGNYSKDAASITFSLGEPLSENIVQTIDLSDWSGTKTGCSIIDGELVADDDSGLMWATESWDDSDDAAWGTDPYAGEATPMWSIDSSLMWDNNYLALNYTDSFISEHDGLLFLNAEKSGPLELFYRSLYNSGMWGEDADVMWTDDTALMLQENRMWLPYTGPVQARRQSYYIKAVIKGGKTRGKLTGLKATIDMPDKLEKLGDIIIPSEGIRLPITTEFKAIKHVSITLQDDGGSAATAKIIDKDTASGPLIKLFDTNGNATSGLIDATVQGY